MFCSTSFSFRHYAIDFSTQLQELTFVHTKFELQNLSTSDVFVLITLICQMFRRRHRFAFLHFLPPRLD